MSLDIIGKLFDIDNTNPESPVVTELDGWHVNSPVIIDGLDAYRIEPAHKRRVFAGAELGVQTYCYRFDTEEQARELLGLDQEVPM